MSARTRRLAVLSAGILGLAMFGGQTAVAKGPPTTESANNLSVPAVFVPSVGLGLAYPCGAAVDPDDVATNATSFFPSLPVSDNLPNGVAAGDYYVQGEDRWQAGCTTADVDTVTVEADWGDNLQSAPLKARTPIRVEIGLLGDTSTYALTGFDVVKLTDELLLALGRPQEARAALPPPTPGDAGWPIRVLAVLVDAVAADDLGRHEESARLLDRALDAAESRGLLQPFLRFGTRLRPMLSARIARGTSREAFAITVLARISGPEPREVGHSLYAEALTPRELEVLRELQGTATREEVARRLFVSVNTLRTHVKHINRKLGTRTSREAVARARELTLL